MTTPFAHIQTRHEPSTEPNESKVALVATLSIEANSDQTIDAYLGGLQMYNDLFEWRLDEYPQKALDLIIDCFLPAESVPQSILKNGVSVGLTRSRVFQSGDWISGKQWLQLASTSTPGGEVDPNRLLADGQIFSLRPGKVDFFPVYALDGSNGYRPISRLRDVLSVLSTRMDEWSMAAWFQSENSSLGGIAPKALLLSAPERVLAAAKKKPRGRRVSR
ncbi:MULTISPECIES: hypothetical protein [Pseudomonas]|jgi:hypothetical protein|uniref:Uncharacterized protein n=1 Tax=Pseudomonas putida (strain ATCC 47054 / DSM 6125 / CFBP 8728 / NCIMB 11950 / KT2440) TaxID=160488 RepID=A0A140FWU3_PSEPK|nr:MULTISPECIES: hypothetical protein [Pseudomonas]AMM03076.1 protein of unknown function [Pseudomonas putida KT2440]KMU93068.1 hypothetical protein AC138_26890 [Pseudomonas putida]KMY38450.1 hypothetical protein AA993_00030 [Pseudomonas putida]MDD2079994.1 hypothetical protein [Pseudomonas putida]MDM9597902.1 hypothetical protein [Pseudomonas shirazica]